jgi:hypothetical protein
MQHHHVLSLLLLASMHNLCHVYEIIYETTDIVSTLHIGKTMFSQISFLDQCNGDSDGKDHDGEDDVNIDDSSVGEMQYSESWDR